MKRFQLCTTVTAMVLGFSFVGSVQAGDKGSGHKQIGTASSMQSSMKTNTLSTGGQSGAIANNLKKQGSAMQQIQSNTASNMKSKKIDPGQLMKKNNGPQGNSQQ